ncbi:MAG: four helix bundle protein [Bacteroidota bacterium]
MNDLVERIFVFSTDVIKFLRTVPNNVETNVLKYQLIKSATSVGANYEEAQAGISRREFKAKVSIALKEAREANYWIRIFVEIGLSKEKEINRLLKESEELKSILGSIVSKMHKTINQ